MRTHHSFIKIALISATGFALGAVLTLSVAIPVRVARADNRPPEERGAIALGQAIARLGVVASVLHTGAHPDDEDSGLLAYLARGRQARTAYLSLTRGDGGQNLIGPELYETLGVIRTEELLAARRLDGATQFFTRAYDFGFSKRRTEALSKWDREAVLSDMVRVIRTFRPLVIVSQWSGTPNDGHGHHQAAGFLTVEAYRAAADPSRFPEQIAQGLRPCKARKLYASARERRRRQQNVEADNPTLSINTGRFDPLLGRSYLEIALQGRSQHRSQDQGTIERRGPQFSRLRLIEGSAASPKEEKDIFDGIDTTLTGISDYAGRAGARIRPLLTDAQKAADEARVRFNPLSPDRVSAAIARGLKAVREAVAALSALGLSGSELYESDFLLRAKERDFENALAMAEGVVVDCLADEEIVTPGQTFGLTVSTYSSAGAANVSIEAPRGWSVERQKQSSAATDGRQVSQTEFRVTVARDAEITEPYWLKNPRKGDMFMPGAAGTGIEPFAPPAVSAKVELQIEGQSVVVTQPVQFRYADKALGEIRRDVKVAPAVSVTVSPTVLIYPVTSGGREATVSIVSNSKESVRGKVVLKQAGASGQRSDIRPSGFDFELKRKGERAGFSFLVTMPAAESEQESRLSASATVEGREYTNGYQIVAYAHTEPRLVYRAASVKAALLDVKTAPGLRVGLIEGAGDDFANALKRLGVDVTVIDGRELASGDLSRYDTIVTGVRVYEVRPDVIANNSRLLDYVKNGGSLIVQYNKNEYAAGNFAPYPLMMESRRERRDPDQREQPRLVYVEEGEVEEMLDARNAPGIKVAFIGSAQDRAARGLSGRGANVTLLGEGDLTQADLSRFDVIVTGVGAAQTRPDLAANNARLIDYSRRGSLVVSYSKSEFQTGEFPVYPRIDVRPYRVTDERAVVTLLDPDHPLFNYPNRITEKDWQGWVQERGTYFMSEWDASFKPLISSHDPGEEPRPGGQLIARYGRGWYVYTGYAWFRQLPEGVPGAYRLIANLVSLPKAGSQPQR